MLQPVKRSTIGDNIIAQIKRLIADGKLKPGDKLPPERQLMETFQVGRTSLREALKVLESQGLLRRSQSGTFISDDFHGFFSDALTYRLYLMDTEVDDVFETRRVIEKELAYLAALRATEEDLRAIEEAVKSMRSAVQKGQADQFAKADILFHERIARASGNSLMFDIYLSIRDLVFYVQEKALSIKGVMEEALKAHLAIMEGIRSKDAEKARESMLAHLESVHLHAQKKGRKPVTEEERG